MVLINDYSVAWSVVTLYLCFSVHVHIAIAQIIALPSFSCLKSAMEAAEQCVKSVKN